MTYIFYCLNCKAEYGAEYEGDFEKLKNEYGEFEVAPCLYCGETKAKVIGERVMVGIMGATDPTREADLEILADRKNKYGDRKVFDTVYAQSKDLNITEGRKQLVEAHKRKDVDGANKIEDGLRSYTKAKYGK